MPRSLRKLWLSCAWQFIGLLVLAVLVALVYWRSHCLHKDDYQTSVTKLTAASLQSFRLRLSESNSEIELAQDGKAVRDVGALAAAPFGLEKQASFKGTLNKYLAVAKGLTAAFRSRRDDLLAQFQTEHGGALRSLPMSAVGVVSTNSNWRWRFSDLEYQALAARKNVDFWLNLQRTLPSKGCFAPQMTTEIIVTGDGKPDAKQPLVERIIGQSLAEGMLMAKQSPGKDELPVPAEAKAQMQAYFATALREIAASAAVTNSPTTVEQLLNTKSENLNCELSEVVQGELGGLWLLGYYRWFEIIFWVWFGVMTNGLIIHGYFLVGANRGSIYEPRESLRVLAKLFYAPLLALALFFLATFISAGQEAIALGSSSPVQLGFAFVLGLFPNQAYQLLKDLATRWFSEKIRAGATRKAEPKPIAAKIATGDEVTGSKPNIERLKNNVVNIATACLESQ